MFLLEPIRVPFAFCESIYLFFAVWIVNGKRTRLGDYFAKLNRMKLYANRAQDALPQTAMFNAVLEHFARKRDDDRIPKCLVIGYDGARADAPAITLGDNEAGIQALLNDGGAAWNVFAGGNLGNLQKTDTAPGWMTMLTGRWATQKDGRGHGVTGNRIPKAREPKVLFTELLERGLTGRTAFVVSWKGHFVSDDANYQNDIAYCEEQGLNARWITEENDDATFERTLAELRDPAAGMVMCILEHCDKPDGGRGSYNPVYVEEMRQAEREAYALIQAVKARPSYKDEDWLLIITSDHGGTHRGHGNQFAETRQVFLASNKRLEFGAQEKNRYIF